MSHPCVMTLGRGGAGREMRTGFRPRVSIMPVLLLVAGVVVWSATPVARQDGVADGIIAGTVASDNGPEAGVWVIAEADGL